MLKIIVAVLSIPLVPCVAQERAPQAGWHWRPQS